jgi:uncharacterized protein DUF4234
MTPCLHPLTLAVRGRKVVRMSEPEQPTAQDSGAPVAAQAQGPLGQPRGVAFAIVLSIVTLGIYHLYWIFKNFDEMHRHTGKGIGGVLALVIAIVIGPVIWFVMPSEVGRMYRDDGGPGPMTGWTGLWLLLPIVGWFVWMVKIQGALNRYWESKGAAA